MKQEQYSPNVVAIVPVYNVEQYIEQCLISLVNQTYPFAQIILVDDGSTDSSGIICDAFAEEYSYMTVIHKANAGLGFARNSGLDVVSNATDYVMFVDSDDWLEKDAVARLVSAMNNIPADCVIGGYVKRNDEYKKIYEYKKKFREFEHKEIQDYLMPRLCGSAPALSDSVPMSVWSTLFNYHLIKQLEIRFRSEREVISEDFFFKFKVFQHSSRVVQSDSTRYNYRTNPHSLSSSYRADRFEATIHFYNEAIEVIHEANLPHDAVIRVQKTLLIYLRKCISQELPKTSGKTTKGAISRLGEIVSDKRVQSVVKTYPVSKLRLRQQIFVNLIKEKCSVLLFLVAKCGLV